MLSKNVRLDIDMVNRVIRSLKDGSRNGSQAMAWINPRYNSNIFYRNNRTLEFHSAWGRYISQAMASSWKDDLLDCLTVVPEYKRALKDCEEFKRFLKAAERPKAYRNASRSQYLSHLRDLEFDRERAHEPTF